MEGLECVLKYKYFGLVKNSVGCTEDELTHTFHNGGKIYDVLGKKGEGKVIPWNIKVPLCERVVVSSHVWL